MIQLSQGDSYYVIDNNLNIIDISDSCFNISMFQCFTRIDVLNKYLWNIIPKFKNTIYDTKLQEAIETNQFIHFEMKCAYNNDCWHVIQIFPFFTNKFLIHFTNIITKNDILYKLQLQNEQLSFVNSELKQLVYALTHDLRNPINTFVAYLEILALNVNKFNLEDHDIIVKLFSSVEQMKNVLKGIVKLVEISQQPLILNEFDIGSLIETMIVSYNNKKSCEYHIEKTIIKADIDLMKLVISNLIDNIFKYSKEHVIINFNHFTNDNNDIIYSLSDNGIGFDPSKSEEIFQPFKRAHRHIFGSGLGLSIVKRIIQYHGGKIWATSSKNGSTFFFTLQCSQFNKNNMTIKKDELEQINDLIAVI